MYENWSRWAPFVTDAGDPSVAAFFFFSQSVHSVWPSGKGGGLAVWWLGPGRAMAQRCTTGRRCMYLPPSLPPLFLVAKPPRIRGEGGARRASLRHGPPWAEPAAQGIEVALGGEPEWLPPLGLVVSG